MLPGGVTYVDQEAQSLERDTLSRLSKMIGRKHTIRTHPQVEGIREKILSEAVSYREIVDVVSLSAVKHFAVEIKSIKAEQ